MISTSLKRIPASFVRSFIMLVPLLGACEIATAPLPHGAERFDPPAVYAQWWSLTEQCSGIIRVRRSLAAAMAPSSVLVRA